MLAGSPVPHSCGLLSPLVDCRGRSLSEPGGGLWCVLHFFEKRGDLAFVWPLEKLKGLQEALWLG